MHARFLKRPVATVGKHCGCMLVQGLDDCEFNQYFPSLTPFTARSALPVNYDLARFYVFSLKVVFDPAARFV